MPKSVSSLNKKILLIVFIILLIILIGATLRLPTEQTHIPLSPISPTSTIIREKAKVAFVYDGDTIELTDGRKVRYIGIDAPERGSNKVKGDCFGQEAFEINKSLVAGQTIEMEKNLDDLDKYGRILRYIWVDDVFINEFLVRQGYAKIMKIPPDTKYAKQLEEVEIEAREGKRGIWGKCK